ncbi:NIPSNAP family protein [Aeoliella sp. SH292]|uniref:NIPSNAP family protein n=1 Tax=Aeoliella sp. SH292 TaxID=3454464 RepID=UPI003F9D9ACE
MMNHSPKSTAAIVTLSLTVAALLVLQASADDKPESAEPSKVSAGEPDKSTQAYELRIYTAAPGKMEALHKRFRDHTLKFFEKHGIKSVGYWDTENAEGEKQLYYIVAYPDQASRDKMLVKGVAADPDFLNVVKDSEVDGKLTSKIESVMLSPTDYSPLQ